MNLKQTLKAILIGFLFGVGMVWLLSVIIPITMGHNPAKFIRGCIEDISSMSMLIGGICSVFWLIATSASQKRRKREELENEMLEYFRRQKEKEENG